jgi:hypothetical protein
VRVEACTRFCDSVVRNLDGTISDSWLAASRCAGLP